MFCNVCGFHRNWRRSANNRYTSGPNRSDDIAATGASRRGPRTISSSLIAPHSPKLQSPTDQNSSDVGNEEWETASESSDVLTHHHHHHHYNQDGNDVKKPQSFAADRGNRRVDSLTDSSLRNYVPEGSSTSRRIGQTGRGNGVSVRNNGRHGVVSNATSDKQSVETTAMRATVSAGDVTSK